MDLIIGSHVSFTKDEGLFGAAKEAISYGSNTFMFYTGAPQNTLRHEVNINKYLEGMELIKKNNINYENVIVHAPYIINLASNDKEKRDFGVRFLIDEINRCEELGIKNLVVHPGNHTGSGEEIGLNNIIDSLNKVLKVDSPVIVLIETMSGKGSELCYNIDQIKYIISRISAKDRIGICLDTCHLNDAGYDLKNFDKLLDEIDLKVGLGFVKCMHINDSKNIIGSKKDRHENIGYGTIGFETLINIIYNKNLKSIPKILETPYVSKIDNEKDKIYPPYKYEIKMIRDKKFNDKLLEDIRNKV